MIAGRFVVDASVAAKWYFPEDLTERADAVLEKAGEILAPDILVLEIAQLAWKRARRGEITEAIAERIVAELRKVPFDFKPAAGLVAAALPLALHHGLTLTDALYLALAVQADCPLVTADRRLFDALRAGPLTSHASWLGDFS